MKKNRLLLLVLPILLLLTGCPYNSAIPLSVVPSTPIDKALLGEWKSKAEPNDSSVMTVYEFNKNEYSIVIVDRTDLKLTVDHYRAFLTPVAGKVLLNLENLKEKGSYNFCSYAVE